VHPLRDWNQCGEIAPKYVVAVTAIARPKRFIQSLQEVGIHVESSFFFPDHYSFSASDMQELWGQGSAIAVTAKDAVKLLPIWPQNMPLWVLEQSSKAEAGLLEAILNHLPLMKEKSS